MHRRPASVPMRLRHPGDEVSITIEDDAADAARVRQMVRGVLPVGVADITRDDVLLVVSELITNALLHGASPRRLHLALRERDLHIEVEDASARTPAAVDPTGRVGGHGLHIVARLCTDWGTAPSDGGKRVWCDVPVQPVHPDG